jgi:hypothetical protein
MIKKDKIGKVSKGLSDKEEELSKEYYNAMIATNKRSLVKKYGKDAEKMAKGTSIKRAKSKMRKETELKIKEAVKSALMNPISEKKGRDLNNDDKIDSTDYLAARDLAIKKAMTKKPLQEDDWMQADDESDMAGSQLTSIKQNVNKLAGIIDDGEQLDAWVQAKLTKAEDYLNSVYNYLQGEEVQRNEPIMEYGEDEFDRSPEMYSRGSKNSEDSSKFSEGDQVVIKPYVGGGTGVVANVKGHFVVLDNGMSYHEDDLEIPEEEEITIDDDDIELEPDNELFENYKKSLTEKIMSKFKK